MTDTLTLRNGLVLPRVLGLEVRQSKTPVLSGNPPANKICINCGGMGDVRLLFLKQWDGRNSNTWWDGKWWGYDERRAPCPVCNADNSERIALLISSCGLQGREIELRVDYCRAMDGKAEAVGAANKLLAQTPSPRGWVTYYGGFGVGKTGILKGLVASFVKAGVQAHYTTSAEILSQIRQTYNHSDETEQDVIARYSHIRVLAVDEVDRVNDTDWVREQMFRLMNARYSGRLSLATIIATNSPAGQMGEQWKYLESRMKDGDRVIMGGEDLRGK